MCACVSSARTVCQALVCGEMPCVIVSCSVDHSHLRNKTHYPHCARKYPLFPGCVLTSSRFLLTSYIYLCKSAFSCILGSGNSGLLDRRRSAFKMYLLVSCVPALKAVHQPG